MKLESKPKKPLNVQKIIKQAVSLILQEDKEKNIRAILLFGSHADGTAIWRSDIDICTLFKDTPSLQDATLFRIKITAQLPDIVDIQVFNTLPQKIQKSIADNHKILFSTPSFDDFNFTLGTQKLFFESKRKLTAIPA